MYNRNITKSCSILQFLVTINVNGSERTKTQQWAYLNRKNLRWSQNWKFDIMLIKQETNRVRQIGRKTQRGTQNGEAVLSAKAWARTTLFYFQDASSLIPDMKIQCKFYIERHDHHLSTTWDWQTNKFSTLNTLWKKLRTIGVQISEELNQKKWNKINKFFLK